MKYRHRGYKDDEYAADRGKKKAPPEKRDDGLPRHRLAEKRVATLVFRCHNCGFQQVAPESVGSAETCAGCSQALHCCMNCMMFDPGVPRECREGLVTVAVGSKRTANECPHFRAKAVLDATGRREESGRPLTAREAFDNLFKKK